MVNIITPKGEEKQMHTISIPIVDTLMSNETYNDLLLDGYILDNIVVIKNKGITVYDYLFRKEISK